MQTVYSTGMKVIFNDLPAIVTLLADNKNINFSCVSFDHSSTISIENALMEWQKNIFPVENKIEKVNSNVLNLTDTQLLELKRREHYVKELKERSINGGPMGVKARAQVIEYVRHKINDHKGMSVATLARLLELDKNHKYGIASTILKNKRKRKSSFTDDEKDYVIEKIHQYLLKKTKPTVKYAYDLYRHDLAKEYGESAKCVSYETFNIWFKELYWLDVLILTKGKRAAKYACRNAAQKFYTEKILERVEADAVNLAIGIVDENGKYLGPVTLYAVIDTFSRAILGINVQIGRGETSASVIDCFKHAIAPKPKSSLSIEAKNEWPMYGIFDKCAIDGGSAYNSLETKKFLVEFTGSIEVVEPAAGWKKPFIERFFSTLRNQFAKTLPGYVGKYKGDKMDDMKIEKEAVITKSEFYSLLTHWLVDEYHQSPHSSLDNQTPQAVWNKESEYYPPLLPENYERLLSVKGSIKKRKITGDYGCQGVNINNVRYNDKQGRLQDIYMKLRNRGYEPYVDCEYSENNIKSINVIDPISYEVFEVFAVDSEIYDGRSLIEHEASSTKKDRNKGFGHDRFTANSDLYKEVVQRHKKHTKSKPRKRDNSFKEVSLTNKKFNYDSDDINANDIIITNEGYDYE